MHVLWLSLPPSPPAPSASLLAGAPQAPCSQSPGCFQPPGVRAAPLCLEVPLGACQTPPSPELRGCASSHCPVPASLTPAHGCLLHASRLGSCVEGLPPVITREHSVKDASPMGLPLSLASSLPSGLPLAFLSHSFREAFVNSSPQRIWRVPFSPIYSI